MDYAIFKSGGRQYRVKPGDVIDVDKIPADEGSWVELTDVLAVSRDGQLTLGNPIVPQASVLAQVQAQDRDAKIIVFKYKRKVRYRRKKGHRQAYTRLTITSVAVGGEEIAVLEMPEPRVAVQDETPIKAADELDEEALAEEITGELEEESPEEVPGVLEEEPPAAEVVAELEGEPAEEPAEESDEKVIDKPRAKRKTRTAKPGEGDS